MPNKSNKKKSVRSISKLILRWVSLARRLLTNNLFWFFSFFVAVFLAYSHYSANLTKINSSMFSISKIEFDGNERIPEVLLLKTSRLRYKGNIFIPDLNEIKSSLENIAWVKSAVVQRKLPNQIFVRISERIPIAILQSKYRLYLVDSDGTILEHDGIGDFNNLPIIVGEGAEKEVSHLLRCLRKFPKIKKQFVIAVRVGKRRWDLKISKGIVVKLPESGVMHALSILEEISNSKGFFNDDICSIDLRILDRVVITKKDQERRPG